MKTNLLIGLNLILTTALNAQVGINTVNPEATLHINGNARINSVQEITNLNNAKILTYNETTAEVPKADISLLQSFNNTTIAKATSSGGTPKIGILKHLSNGGYTELNTKDFSGAILPLVLSLLISDTEINSIHKLNKDDVLS